MWYFQRLLTFYQIIRSHNSESYNLNCLKLSMQIILDISQQLLFILLSPLSSLLFFSSWFLFVTANDFLL